MKHYFLIIITTFFIIFSSCEKEELIEEQSSAPEIEIKTIQNGETQSIALNDTLFGERNVNTIFWTENGESVNWHIVELNSHNYGYTYNDFKYGSQIDFKFKHHGIYSITLREYDTVSSDIIHQFYIKIEGIPGKVGDGPENDHIFRMEVMADILGQEHLFVYYKFTDNYLEHLLINQEFNNYTMNSFDYSDEPYYYFMLPIETGNYNLKFMKTIDGVDFMMEDGNMKYSSYYAGNNWLEFFLP